MTSNDSTTEAKFMQFSFPSFGDMLATSGGTPTATSSPLHNLNALGLGALDTSLGNPNALLGHHHHHHQLHQHHQHMQQQNPNVHHDVADHLSCLSDNQGNLQQHQLPPQHQTQPQPHLELNQQQSQQPGVPGAGDMSNPTEGIITASLLSAMAAAHSIRFPHAAQLNPSAPQLLNPQAAPNGNLFDASVVNPADASAQAAAAAMPTTVKRKRRSSKANILQGNAPIMCSNCNAVNTPLWRTGEGGRTLCNKCGLYWKRNGTQRPPKLDRRRNSAPNVAATKQKRSPKRPRYDNPESSAAQDYSKTINLTFLESNGQGAAQAAQQSYNQELLNNLIDRRMSIDDEMSRLSADADIRRMSVDESMVRSGQDRLDNINAFPQIDFSQLQSLSMQLNPTLPVNPNAQAQASQTYNKLYEIVQQQQQRIEELKKQIGIQQYLKQFSTTKSGANDFLLSASSPIGLSGSVSPSVAMTTSSAPDYSDQMSQDMSSQLPQISVQPPQGSPLQNQQAFSNLMNSMNYPLTITTNGTKSQMPNHEIFTLSPLLLFSPKTPDRDLVNNFLLELEQPGSTGATAEGASTTTFAVTPHKEPDTNSSNVNNTTASSNFSLNF